LSTQARAPVASPCWQLDRPHEADNGRCNKYQLFGTYQDCNPLLSGPNAGTFACEGDGEVNCTCAHPGPDCACERMFAPVGRQKTGNGNGPSQPCSNYTTVAACDATQGDCLWNAKSDQCAPFGCSNVTAATGGERMCSKTWECMWLDGACADYDCAKLTTAKECFNASGSYPTGHFCKVQVNGECGGGFNRNDKTMNWRDTVFDMMDGYWYSTNAAGHCGSHSESSEGTAQGEDETAAVAAKPCTWHIAEIEKVPHSREHSCL
jgi:hypothetical protein